MIPGHVTFIVNMASNAIFGKRNVEKFLHTPIIHLDEDNSIALSCLSPATYDQGDIRTRVISRAGLSRLADL